MAEQAPDRAALSAEHAARYARQIMLSDVGVAGQAAIARAVARVEGVAVAERYALRTGFEGVAPGTLDVEALAPHPIVRHDAPRALLASARAVLTEVRRCLRETKP